MTKQLKEIEIPFGAKDSELCGWEYTIPEGMEATIVDNKIVVKKKESEDERIRKALKEYLINSFQNNGVAAICGVHIKDILSWLEKQGEQNQKHFELKAEHWYICHRAFCCRADHLTVKEGERFKCEKDGVVKGFVIKEPEKYFKEVCPPAPIEDEQKPVWSEEDEEMRNNIIGLLVRISANTRTDSTSPNFSYPREIEWLKSLRPQNWTKEDKERYISCLQRLGTGNPEQPETINSKWFKEHVYPQTTWKPSDEQMSALDAVIDEYNGYPEFDSLVSLKNDLKKLKG